MNLSKSYDPKKTEGRIYKLWQKSGFLNPDNLPKRHKKPYVIVIPPPNVTGRIHMGHALNAIVQDSLIRRKRMQGFKTLWLPGTDHAGIATQNVVEKQLKKQGLTRFDLGKEKFTEKVWEWKKEYGNIILNQFKKIGASLDWSRTRFTMDKDYALAVKTAFLYYYKKGWIYKGKRVINWCSRCQTSLSDLEVEHEEEKGKLWYIRYPLEKGNIVVATTRPETMLGDTAIAVSPKDKRYKDLVGKKAILPLMGKEIPIIADRNIDQDFGTGALKLTPAHSLIDYEIGLKHNLEIVQVINGKGKMIAPAPLPYQGLNIREAREKIIEDLKEQNLLEKEENFIHQIPKCYRCGTTVEAIPSWQWFLKMDELSKKAIKAVKTGKVQFFPKRWEKTYFTWLENVRDWCISRQIWWGHKIPIEGETDVLDTWFSSALWPFATLGWPKKDIKEFYPTDTLSTARDIINLWVSRMIFSGLEFTKKVPFKKVYVHPTMLTKDGKRMSKSLGTGIDPLELIEKYGADAVRFGVAYQITELQDVRFSEDSIVMGKKFCNKIWNAGRFVMQQDKGSSQFSSSKPKTVLNKDDKKILKSLDKTIKITNKNMEAFRFGKATRVLYDFFWHDFCDQYIEKAKANPSKEKRQILFFVLLTSLKLLHPFIPFITEEIYQKLPIKNKKECLMIEEWPK